MSPMMRHTAREPRANSTQEARRHIRATEKQQWLAEAHADLPRGVVLAR